MKAKLTRPAAGGGSRRSTVSLEGEGVVALPGGAAGWPDLVRPVSLHAQAAVILAGAGQAAQLSVLVHGVHDPVESGVLWINIPWLSLT